jgi:hypothetical protein
MVCARFISRALAAKPYENFFPETANLELIDSNVIVSRALAD